jgi:chromosome segregation ATPase
MREKIINNRQDILLAIVMVLALWNILNTNGIKTDVKSYKEKIENIQVEIDSAQSVNKEMDEKVLVIKETVNSITKEIHEIDNNIEMVSVRVARLVYQDLLKYDGLKEEMGFMKLKLQKVEERESQKDNMITILTQKDENNQFIIGKKDDQLKLSKELTDSLHKELKGQRAQTFLWKVGTFVGLGLTSFLLIGN